jgi:hypothetical protein
MKTLTVLVLGCVAVLTGCGASRETILTVPAISMTEPSTTDGVHASKGDRVSAEYCKGDDTIASQGDQNVGLIDEAVMKAQKQSGAAYLADVTISQKGGCVTVEGIAMK